MPLALRAGDRQAVQAFVTAIGGLRSELVRWMFGFWVSTLLGIAGLLIALGNR